jgi:hypothetical protein
VLTRPEPAHLPGALAASPQAAVPPGSSGVGSSREQTVSIPLHHIPTGPGAQQFERMSLTTTRNSSSRVISARNVAEKAHAVPSARSSVPFRPEPKDPPPAPPTVGPATSTRDQQALGQSALARQRFRCCWLVNDRVVKWLTGVVDTYVETIIRAESTRDPTFAIMVIVSGHRGCGASLSRSRRRQTCACWR